MDALEIAAQYGEAERAARVAQREAGEAVAAARTAMYDAERAQREAGELATLEAARLRALLRGLAHRAEIEPTEERSQYGEAATTYRATFGETRYSVRASSGRWSSKPQPQVAEAYGWDRRPDARAAAGNGNGNGTDLYRSARGTSDPAKLAAEADAAKAAALAFARTLTGAAYLAGLGIDPATAPDPSALIEARPLVTRRSDWWQGERVAYWSVSWIPTLRASGEPLADFRAVTAHDIGDARAEAAAKADGRAYAEVTERQTASEALQPPASAATEAEVTAWADALAPEALALIVGRL